MIINLKKIMAAMRKIQNDRFLELEDVKKSLSDSLVWAFRKEYQNNELLAEVVFDEESGEIHLYHIRIVKEEVVTPDLDISLEEARTYNPLAYYGDQIKTLVDMDNFSRIAIAMARNTMKKQVLETSREIIIEKFQKLIDTLVVGIIHTKEPSKLVVEIDNFLCIIPASQLLPQDYENYREGDKIKAVVTKVNKEGKNLRVVLSRITANFVHRLMEKEIPELASGLVTVERIARIPGEITKVAVKSHRPNLDPVRTCMGLKRGRILAVSQKIYGEKIELCRYHEEVLPLLHSLFFPVLLRKIHLLEDGTILLVVDYQDLSKAIGLKGRHVKVASRLMQCKILVKTPEQARDMKLELTNATTPNKLEIAKDKKEIYQKTAREKLQTIERIDGVEGEDITVDLISKNERTSEVVEEHEKLNISDEQFQLLEEEIGDYYEEDTWLDEEEYDEYYDDKEYSDLYY